MTIKKIIGGGLLFVGLFSTAFFGYAQDAGNLEKDTVLPPIILPSNITKEQLDQIRAIIREPKQAAQQNSRSVTEQIMAASVRLKGRGPDWLDFGSGTIIDDGSRDGKVKILTCGHIFRELDPTGFLEATIFTPQGAQTIRTKLIKYDLESDVGITQFSRSDLKGAAPFAARVAPVGITLAPGMTVQSVGCGGGDDPTIQTITVTALGRYVGPDNIECSGVPAHGRSGGGLFTKEGVVVGVCSAADPRDQRGVYAGPRAIQDVLDKARLSHLYQSGQPVIVAPSSPSPVSPPPTSIIPFPFEAPVTTVTICPIKKKDGVYTCHDLILGVDIPLEYRRDGKTSREDYHAIARIEKSGGKALVESELVYDENGKVIRSKTIRVREANSKEQSAIKELEKKLGRLSVLPPTRPSEPLPIPPSTSRIIQSPNFIITSSTGEISSAVCQVAEEILRQNPHIAGGRRLARPIDITCQVGHYLGAGGVTTFHFVRDPVNGETHVVGFKSEVQGSLERILDSVIPHEIQHVVNALFWRKKFPRWADEGVATLVEHESEQYRQRLTAAQSLQRNTLIPLNQLVTIMEYPRDMKQVMIIYAEGFMLSDLLKSRLEQKFGPQILKDTEEKNRYENIILGFSLAAKEKGLRNALNIVAFDHQGKLLDRMLGKKYGDLFGIENSREFETQFRRFIEGSVYQKSNNVIRRQ